MPTATGHPTLQHLLLDVELPVIVAAAIAALVSVYVALELVSRAMRAGGPMRPIWLVIAGTTLGGGLWAMHYLAMVGAAEELGGTYRLDLVVVSGLLAGTGCTVGFGIAAHVGVRRSPVTVGVVLTALSIAGMSYLGVASLQGDGDLTWSPWLVALAAVLTVATASLTLRSVASMRRRPAAWSIPRRLLAASVVALTASAAHYAGMAAVTFRRTPGHDPGGVVLNATVVVAVLGLGAYVLLLIVTVDGSRQKRRAENASDLAVMARLARDIGRRGDARTTVCSAACDLLAVDLAVLVEPSGDGGLCVTAAGAGHELDRIGAGRGPALCDHVLRTGEPLFVPDLRRAGGADRSAVATSDAASALLEPVVLDDRVIGVLAVGWRARRSTVDDRTTSFAALLAAECAVAIERTDLVARLREQALIDGLTGLPNRRALDQALDAAVARAARTGQPLTVAMADVDHFKRYNDEHGHPAGDRLLTAIAATWRTELRPEDVVGRYGGEEFLILLPGVDAPAAAGVIERLRVATPERTTCSFGVATWDAEETASALVGRADAALYVAKRSGRDRVVAG